MIKVAIYEDNVGLREVLTSIIRQTDGLSLAGEFGHCMDIIENTKVFNPDIIIMDIDMPGKTGIEGVQEVKREYPKVEVIMNTVFDDDNRVFEAIKAGATGYILKKHSLANLVTNIFDVSNGGAPMSPSIARKLLQLPFASVQNPKKEYELSEKEVKVLNLLSKGLSYKMVSDELQLSIDTIRTYIKRIYEKLHVHNVTEAIYKVFIEK